MKPPPFTVSVKPALPTGTADCDSDCSTGSGLLTEKLAGAESPPPGAGFEATSDSTPALASTDAGSTAVTSVAET